MQGVFNNRLNAPDRQLGTGREKPSRLCKEIWDAVKNLVL